MMPTVLCWISAPPYAARAYSYVTVAQFEALKVAWYYKYLYNRPAPSNADSTVKALLSRVPDDRLLILDYACDYNGTFWRNGMNYEVFGGFHGKPWLYGVVPNMGGKVAYSGVPQSGQNAWARLFPLSAVLM